MVVHAAFNHLPLSPVAMTGLLLVVMPLLVLYVFERSERATREWVGAGLDLDKWHRHLLRQSSRPRVRAWPRLISPKNRPQLIHGFW